MVFYFTYWRIKMSKDNKFRNESQDARRHDQQHEVHPDRKSKNVQDKSHDSHPMKKK